MCVCVCMQWLLQVYYKLFKEIKDSKIGHHQCDTYLIQRFFFREQKIIAREMNISLDDSLTYIN